MKFQSTIRMFRPGPFALINHVEVLYFNLFNRGRRVYTDTIDSKGSRENGRSSWALDHDILLNKALQGQCIFDSSEDRFRL